MIKEREAHTLVCCQVVAKSSLLKSRAKAKLLSEIKIHKDLRNRCVDSPFAIDSPFAMFIVDLLDFACCI